MNGALLTVTQLNKYVHSLLESDQNLKSLFVSGEISNLKINSFSGHIYFTLKDENAAVRSVMFKSNSSRLKFIPKEGMKVICRGTVALYDKDGQYQLYISDMQPDGAGSISIAFEQLKQKLAEEGLFDISRKKPIPTFPKKIAIITSETGAAVRDMISVIGRRWPIATLIMCPVLVQGDGAAGQMILALNNVNSYTDADVIIIGRGGGSQEDLWCFNDEELARAISKSKIPVISAVGHETDFTISDFVADLRAPTPSAAAEICVPDINDVVYTVNDYNLRLNSTINRLITAYNEKLDNINERAVFKNKFQFVEMLSLRLDNLNFNIEKCFNDISLSANQKLLSLTSKLDTLSPSKTLLRGYTITQKNGKVISKTEDIELDDKIEVIFSNGKASCTVNNIERNEPYAK